MSNLGIHRCGHCGGTEGSGHLGNCEAEDPQVLAEKCDSLEKDNKWLRKEIIRLQSPQSSDGWQPISSAPRDGTWITVGCSSKFSPAGWWECVVKWIDYGPDADEEESGHWVITHYNGESLVHWRGLFTHWKKLTAPKASKLEEDSNA